MLQRTRLIVLGIAMCVSRAQAADEGERNIPQADSAELTPHGLAGSPGSASESTSGSPFAVTAQRQVLVQGLIDLDGLIQGNYLSGNNRSSDHRGYGLLRAEIGTKVVLDPRVSATVTFAYYNEAGSATSVGTPAPVNPLPTVRRNHGGMVVDDAFIELKDSFGAQGLGVDAGRMPVRWNLRSGKGAFLYDSRANDPAVTSWDGARAAYTSEGVTVTPYAYRLPDNSSLFGGAIDWRPELSNSCRAFVTGSLNLERNVVLRPTAGDPTPGGGRRLITSYVGAEVEIDAFDIYGEYAKQGGEQARGVHFNGWGGDVGLDWRTHLTSGQRFSLGFKADYLSGDNSPADSRNDAFINNWEGTSDCYIVEHEKYGELSRYLQGNLEDLKISAEVSFDQENRLRLGVIYGTFRSPRPMAGSASNFGQEGDLTLTWQYTINASFRLFGAGFKPSSEFKDIAPAGKTLSRADMVYLMGLNLAVVF